MRVCRHCSHSNADHLSFCSECGRWLGTPTVKLDPRYGRSTFTVDTSKPGRLVVDFKSPDGTYNTVPGTIVAIGQTLFGGPSPDCDLLQRQLEPGMRECTALVNAVAGRSVHEIFGSPDDMKFRSSMTLFREATADNAPFRAALDKYFAGEPDRATLDQL